MSKNQIAFEKHQHHLFSVVPGQPTRNQIRRAPDPRKITVPAGTIFMSEGDACQSRYYVVSGWFAVVKSLPEGERQITDIVLSGEILDPRSANGVTSAVQLEALTDLQLFEVRSLDWDYLRTRLPHLAASEQQAAGAAMSRMSERMLRLGKGSAQTRVAYALLEFCVRLAAVGQFTEKGYHVPLTQQLLGEFVGLSSVHVCRTLRRLSQLGIVRASNSMDIIISNPTALEALAGIDSETLVNEIIA